MKRLKILLMAGLLAVITSLFPAGQSFAKGYAADDVKDIWIVTNEIKVPEKDGHPELEVYRWDPGTIILHQGDRVMLHIYGVKGKSHPFELEGYNLKGVALQPVFPKHITRNDGKKMQRP